MVKLVVTITDEQAKVLDKKWLQYSSPYGNEIWHFAPGLYNMPESYKEEFFRCRNELHQLGIFEIRQPDRNGQRYYVLTDIGQRFYDQIKKQ